MCKINGNGTTLENIHRAAKAEFLEKGYKDASLRNIVKSVGMTTGAFYGYYKSKEELFEAIVGEHYEYILKRFIKAQQEFAELPAAQQPEVMSDISGLCMYDMLHYAYEHLEECKLILCCSEGTKFARLIDEMVEIEEMCIRDRIDYTTEYIQKTFVDKGMCVDWSIHDKGDGNPHVHLLVTMRPFNPNHSWGNKEVKDWDFVRDKNGNIVIDESHPNWWQDKKN